MGQPALFAAQIAPDAINSCINTGVFPSVVIAQAIQESGSGQSKLAQLGKNFFGHIATASWAGRTIQLVKNGKLWRVYDSVAQSIKAHLHVLNSPLYHLAGVFSAKTPFEQIQALQQAGYDAGPDKAQYAAKISRIITGLNLQQYDEALFAIERRQNHDHLAFYQRNALQKLVHNITT